VTGLAEKFLGAGKAIVEAIWEGIKKAWTWLTDSVSGLVDDLVSILPDFITGGTSSGGTIDLVGIFDPEALLKNAGMVGNESGAAFGAAFGAGIKSSGSGLTDSLSGVLGDADELLPHSDAKVGPLSELTKSGASLLPTFASGIEQNADAPIRAVSNALSNVSMDAPIIPTAQSREPKSTAKAGVVFEPGAFQITVTGADGMDDLEGQLTEIFSRAALRLGVTHA